MSYTANTVSEAFENIAKALRNVGIDVNKDGVTDETNDKMKPDQMADIIEEQLTTKMTTESTDNEATSSDILPGKHAYKSDKSRIDGSMPLATGSNMTLSFNKINSTGYVNVAMTNTDGRYTNKSKYNNGTTSFSTSSPDGVIKKYALTSADYKAILPATFSDNAPNTAASAIHILNGQKAITSGGTLLTGSLKLVPNLAVTNLTPAGPGKISISVESKNKISIGSSGYYSETGTLNLPTSLDFPYVKTINNNNELPTGNNVDTLDIFVDISTGNLYKYNNSAAIKDYVLYKGIINKDADWNRTTATLDNYIGQLADEAISAEEDRIYTFKDSSADSHGYQDEYILNVYIIDRDKACATLYDTEYRQGNPNGNYTRVYNIDISDPQGSHVVTSTCIFKSNDLMNAY